MPDIEQQVTELVQHTAQFHDTTNTLTEDIAQQQTRWQSRQSALTNDLTNLVMEKATERILAFHSRVLWIDPAHGDDRNSGLTEDVPIRTSAGIIARLEDVVPENLTINIVRSFRGTFALQHPLRARHRITINGKTYSDLAGTPKFEELVKITQGKPVGVFLSAPIVHLDQVSLETYKLIAGDALPYQFEKNAMLQGVKQLFVQRAQLATWNLPFLNVNPSSDGEDYTQMEITTENSCIKQNSHHNLRANFFENREVSSAKFPVSWFSRRLKFETSQSLKQFLRLSTTYFRHDFGSHYTRSSGTIT